MPCHLISDTHEWINKIPTVPIYYLAKPQPRERAWQQQWRKKTQLSLTLVWLWKNMRCRISGRSNSQVKYHYSYCVFSYSVKQSWMSCPHFSVKITFLPVDSSQRRCLVGSLAGAARLSNDNAGVLRWAPCEWKSHVEQKGKSPLDFDFQHEYKQWKHGLLIS